MSKNAPQSSPPYRLHESLGYHLSLASRLQERRLEDRLRTVGLNRTTWCILLAVANENLAQPSDIARFVGIDRTATSRALRGMESDGLVARKSGQDDRRTRMITLTDKGRRAVTQATPYARENGRLLAELLTDEENAELKRLLRVLIEGTPADLSAI
ncbi:transcriptional regulatory protein [Pseudooceanicola batsensis HTCC2597]|uniref:Transcriptional regulatory protein n=1 Tax=Pseudooceanicola batsensis (strain ATCC BAA-863 / DSM 15984 / KCTC 12145 / HTCC2597) TaxID=252305 RepID=A3U1Z4_PSEBH|nr:MarR family transcriptional regulator [Pseudooceanicola batsensis]EAQ01928.1 transcriptional regulatory protein [Pseudooceanicola batsensis HTCC2597]